MKNVEESSKNCNKKLENSLKLDYSWDANLIKIPYLLHST